MAGNVRSAAHLLPAPPMVLAHSDALASELEQEIVEIAGMRIAFFDWALKAPEPKSGTLDFARFPFQKELYTQGEDERTGVIRKSTQVGISAWGVRWALYHADTKGMTGLYIFPTQRDVWDFSAARIKPVIDRSEYLRSRQRPDDPDNKGMKGIGLGLVYFRGSESKRGLDSVDADHIVFDEYDTLAQENIPDAERRVTGSLKGLIRRLGVPSIPDDGIDGAYQATDQRQWHVKCEGCGLWQDIDFFLNVDLKKAIRVCRDMDCRKPLDVSKGEWVATYPDRDERGYHVSRLIAPLADIPEIVKASKKKAPYERTVFHNKDLGLPYAPAEGRLSKEALAAAQSAGGGYRITPSYAGAKLVTMGVDVASTRNLNVRISEHLGDEKDRKRALWIGEIEDFNELADLMDKYQIQMACIDHLPEGRLARAFAERYPGRVYLVSYDGQPDPKDSEVFKVDEDMRHVRVQRVPAIDATFQMIREQRNLLPLDLPDGYIEQMQKNNRVVAKDEFGKKTVRYRKSPGADDYAHAEVYDVVATAAWEYRQAVDEAASEVLRPLEDMLDFERSNLADYDRASEYDAGPDDPTSGY